MNGEELQIALEFIGIIRVELSEKNLKCCTQIIQWKQFRLFNLLEETDKKSHQSFLR